MLVFSITVTMRVLIIFLLPVAFAASVPEKRMIVDSFLNGNETKAIVSQLITFLSSDDNEAKCEQECHVLIRNQDSVMQHLCPFLCHTAQQALSGIPHKRVLLDTFLNGNETKSIVNQLITFLSSDDNEAKCEQECHVLIRNQDSVMQHLCPFLCHTAQQALSGIPHKRVLIETFLNGQEATHIIDQLVESLGTADNEAKCEQECHVLIRDQTSVIQHLCPFLCHSAMLALNNLHSHNTDPTSVGKRLVLGNLLNTEETSKIIDQLVATLGSHESEVQCEKECHILIRDSTSVFQHMCPFLCHSAEAIFNSIGHHSTPPAGNPVRRILIDTAPFLNTEEISKIIDQLVAALTSSSSEALCEQECHTLIRDSTSVFQHMCPFMCHSAQAIVNKLHHTTAAPA